MACCRSLRGGNPSGSSSETISVNSFSNPSISVGIFVKEKTLGGELGKEVEFEASFLAKIVR